MRGKDNIKKDNRNYGYSNSCSNNGGNDNAIMIKFMNIKISEGDIIDKLLS